MGTSYQEKAWKENRNKIIELLSVQPLTFKELIEKSRLSRAVVNQHLKDLQKPENAVVKKEYKDGKIVNILQMERLNLVEWFISQLESLDIPREVVEKGREILNQDILVFSAFIYLKIWENIHKICEHLSPQELWKSVEIEKFSVLSSKVQTPSFHISIFEDEKEIQAAMRKLLGQLNPYCFNVTSTVYELERVLHQVYNLEAEELIYSKIPNDLKREDFEKVLEWWFKDVLEYLPSAHFFQALTVTYFNVLLRMHELPKDFPAFTLTRSKKT